MRNDLMAVVGAPVVVWLVCLGCGLALERLLRIRVSNALLLPLGLCVALALIYPGYAAGAGDALAIVLLVGVGLAGLVLAKEGLRARLNPGWAGAAGLGIYLLYMLPVLAYGHWTWSGYDFVNDSAFEMLLASHIKGYGLTLGKIPLTSEQQFLMSYLNSGYPLGTQSLLGTLSGLTDTDVAVLYQGFIASMAGLAAVALASATQGLLDARRAALAGAAALAANLTYQYALQGAVKEIGLLATLCAGVAVGREAIKLGRPYVGAVMLAVVAAAAMATYDAVAVPFLGALLLFLGLGSMFARRLRPRLGWSGPLVVGLGLAALLSIPSLVSFKTFFAVASSGQGTTGVGATQFGQLLRVLPLSQLSGVWLAGEYRLAVASHRAELLTALVSVVVLLAIVPCIVWALRRRQVAVLVAIGMVGLVLLVVFPRASPYAQGKLLAMCSPLVVLAGMAGLLGLRTLPGAGGRRAGLVGLLAACGVSLAILASDVLAYSHDRVAPTAQMEAISQTGDHFAGRGLVLWNEFQEYAKYFARAAKISVPFEALTPQQVQLRAPTEFYGHYFDLDEELLSFVEGYPIIVTRRSPSASRPPANYKLVYQNAYYLGWERMRTPQVLEHLPLQQQFSSSLQVRCSALGPIVAKAPRGSELVVATAPEVSWFEALSDLERSGGWTPDPDLPGVVETRTGGHAEGVLEVKHEGTYRVWVQGDFPRPVQVQIDGHTVGSVSGANTPGQWLQAATLHLRPGRYPSRVVMVAGHRHFGPGEWWPGTLGAVELQSATPERMRTLPLSRWRSLCGREADWVEVVRP
ncbi:MAG TPA: hypothetical protein VGP18_09670 [Solirubrobacteraceae bacterium]|nr:hypothetical protein [Solirubrobacteraceae bacterium]